MTVAANARGDLNYQQGPYKRVFGRLCPDTSLLRIYTGPVVNVMVIMKGFFVLSHKGVCMKVETSFSLKTSMVAVFGIKQQWMVDCDSRESLPQGFMIEGREFSDFIKLGLYNQTLVICDDGIFIKCERDGFKFDLYFMPVSEQMAKEHPTSYVEFQTDLGMYPTVAFVHEDEVYEIPSDDYEQAYLNCKSSLSTMEDVMDYIFK